MKGIKNFFLTVFSVALITLGIGANADSSVSGGRVTGDSLGLMVGVVGGVDSACTLKSEGKDSSNNNNLSSVYGYMGGVFGLALGGGTVVVTLSDEEYGLYLGFLLNAMFGLDRACEDAKKIGGLKPEWAFLLVPQVLIGLANEYSLFCVYFGVSLWGVPVKEFSVKEPGVYSGLSFGLMFVYDFVEFFSAFLQGGFKYNSLEFNKKDGKDSKDSLKLNAWGSELRAGLVFTF